MANRPLPGFFDDSDVRVEKKGLSPIYLDLADMPRDVNLVHPRLGRKRRIVFGWYGGKYSHLEWLLPLLPRCHHYCEPFGGLARC